MDTNSLPQNATTHTTGPATDWLITLPPSAEKTVRQLTSVAVSIGAADPEQVAAVVRRGLLAYAGSLVVRPSDREALREAAESIARDRRGSREFFRVELARARAVGLARTPGGRPRTKATARKAVRRC